MKIQIKPGLEIGDGLPPFIIAEVGSNWRTLEDCIYSIHEAKACGADAVKFQLFDWDSLYGIDESIYDGMNPDNCYVLKGQLDPDWLPKLKEKADQVGIEFMCSAFSPRLIEAVDPYVNIHKLASAELTHVRMLEKLREIGKPVLMSTGGHGRHDIAHALWRLRGTECPHPDWKPQVVLMYCVSAYPAQEINLENIGAMLMAFTGLVGYSDHSLDVYNIPALAISKGACIIEKHFQAVDGIFPDSSHSLSVAQFRNMVNVIRKGQVPNLNYTPEEKPMILRHNRRLIATKDIAPGDVLTEGVNFGIYRSLKDETKALSPFLINQVEGHTACKPIQAGDGIHFGDLWPYNI